MEEWKDLVEYPGYRVSSLGNVYSTRHKKHLVKCRNTNGYFIVTLLGKKVRVHRLVALCFIPTNDTLLDIDHINRDRTDNRVENLRWVTRSENMTNTEANKRNMLNEKHISLYKGKYMVRVERNKNIVFYGYYDTLEEAIQNRNCFLNS